jgi:hypothetical protein
MLKKDFLNEANRLTNDFKSLYDSKVDDVDMYKWVGEALGLIRAFRPELATAVRDRNHPYAPENNINLNIFLLDSYSALIEAMTYVQTLSGDDCTV